MYVCNLALFGPAGFKMSETENAHACKNEIVVDINLNLKGIDHC